MWQKNRWLLILTCALLVAMTIASLSEPHHFILDKDTLDTFVYKYAEKHWFSYIKALLHTRLYFTLGDKKPRAVLSGVVHILSYSQKSFMEFRMKAEHAHGGSLYKRFLMWVNYTSMRLGTIWYVMLTFC